MRPLHQSGRPRQGATELGATVDLADLRKAITAQYALPILDDLVALDSVTNQCFQVATPSGRTILKVYRTASVEQVSTELDLLEHLLRAGLPASQPVHGPKGSRVATFEGRPICLLSELPGRPFPPPLDPRSIQLLGAILGNVQRALADFPDRQVLSSVLLTSYDETYSLWEEWYRVVESAVEDPMRSEFMAMIEETFRTAEHVKLERLDWRAIGVQPLHGDYHAGNVLQTDGQWTGILDLEHAQIGPRLFDVATACCVMLINPYEEPEPSIARVQAFVNGYRTTAAPSQAESEHFAQALMLERWADFRIMKRHYEQGDSALDRFVPFDTAYLIWLRRHGDRLMESLWRS